MLHVMLTCDLRCCNARLRFCSSTEEKGVGSSECPTFHVSLMTSGARSFIPYQQLVKQTLTLTRTASLGGQIRHGHLSSDLPLLPPKRQIPPEREPRKCDECYGENVEPAAQFVHVRRKTIPTQRQTTRDTFRHGCNQMMFCADDAKHSRTIHLPILRKSIPRTIRISIPTTILTPIPTSLARIQPPLLRKDTRAIQAVGRLGKL